LFSAKNASVYASLHLSAYNHIHKGASPLGSCTIETGVLFNIIRAFTGATLGLRAVVFDYGMVLTGQPDASAHEKLLSITGLPLDRFESLYWADRAAYDEGKLTGIGYWQKFLREAGLPPDQEKVEELNLWDVRMWSTENPAMIDWQLAIKQRGLLTAILSNMGDAVLASVEREFDWIRRFDLLVWSCQVGVVKPDPAIYRHTLAKLGTRPEELLFIDDKLPNVEAARALNIRTIQFSNVERLREDLIAAGLASELPLPA
jgi:putative hydrolase of the HAD superfamily